MSDLPEPLTTIDCDTKGLPCFMFDAERILNSDLAHLSTGDEFKAAVLLWCRAWRQVPAGSLPDDNRILASFCGVSLKQFTKIKIMALRGFILCRDGRYYHPHLSGEAMTAAAHKSQREDALQTEMERKRQERERRSAMFLELRKVGVTPKYNATSSELKALMAQHIQTQDANPHQEPVRRTSHVNVTTGREQVTAKTGHDMTGHNKTGHLTPPSSGLDSQSEIPSEKIKKTATATTALDGLKSKKYTDRTQQTLEALSDKSLKSLLQANAVNLADNRMMEWERDTDGVQLGVIGAVLWWRKTVHRAPVREASGWRAAYASFMLLTVESRKEVAESFMKSLGIQVGQEVVL